MYYKKEVKIDGSFVGKNYPIELSIAVKGFDDTPDCQIGHFGYNFYFRTPYGLKAKRYKNIYTLYSSIKKVAKGYNLTLENIGLKYNYKYRPILNKK